MRINVIIPSLPFAPICEICGQNEMPGIQAEIEEGRGHIEHLSENIGL